MRILMIVAGGLSYNLSHAAALLRYRSARDVHFETPLTALVWITSAVSVGLTYAASFVLLRDLGDGSLWWKLSTIITCGTMAGAVIPELVKVFTSTRSAHVREIVTSSREGGASLNILSRVVAGNFSAYWLGLAVVFLMGFAHAVGSHGLGELMQAGVFFLLALVFVRKSFYGMRIQTS